MPNKTINLTTSERVYALALLNQFKGNLDVLVDVMEDIKGVRISDEEWTKADKQVNTTTGTDGQPNITWTWDDEKGGEKEIEFSKETTKYLIDKISEMNEKGEFTLQDRAAITLNKKLEKK